VLAEPLRGYPHETLLTTVEASNVLRLSARTLEDMRWRGGGPRYLRLSRNAIRYRQSDLMEWAEAKARVNTSSQLPR
jgi:predicted DNA-binding transcriptional regulator AlpA